MRQLKISQQITKRDSLAVNRYLAEISSIPQITAQEEVRLARLIAEGDLNAVEQLTRANLRFVVSVAKQYQSSGEPLMDLINSGNIGLIEGAKRFDEKRGFKFISYAVWWIRQSILQHIAENNKSIRLPLNKITVMNRLKNLESDLEQRFERKPTTLELSIAFEENFNDGISEKQVEDLLYRNSNPTSMDARVSSDEESGTLHDLLQGNGYEKINQDINKSDLNISINTSLNKLTSIEKYIITSFYGIDCQERSLAEIGERLELTRERVRQIRERSIRKLRSFGVRKLLKEYV